MCKSLAFLVCCREHVAKLSSLFSRSTPASGSELMALRLYRHLFRRLGLSVLAEKSVAAPPLDRSLISRFLEMGVPYG